MSTVFMSSCKEEANHKQYNYTVITETGRSFLIEKKHIRI